jgi:hypothetical protein
MGLSVTPVVTPIDPPYPLATYSPFMAWNRLEARPRQKDFSNSLQAQLYDAVWMLGRQWQVGEFEGNDTGSGITALACFEHQKMQSINHFNGTNAKNIDFRPCEPLVESVSYKFSIKEQILLWQKWQSFFYKEIQSQSKVDAVKALFTSANLSIPFNFDFFAATDAEKIDKSHTFSNKALMSFVKAAAIKNDNCNGAAFYYVLKVGFASQTDFENAFNNLLPGTSAISSVLSSAESQQLNTSVQNFCKWVAEIYPDVSIANEFWKSEKLCYQFESENASGDTYVTSDYNQGNLDWYNYEKVANASPTGNVTTKILKQLIMTNNRFAGMPSSRWWEFENGAVNFCKVDADTTDIAKIILTQFALLYNDDWFMIPFTIPAGSIGSMKGITVTDVFGVNTFIANHNIAYDKSAGANTTKLKTVPDNWKDWSWFDIHYKSNMLSNTESANEIIFPDNVIKIQEGKPFEKVIFTVDEMSNMVWAIEEIVPNQLGFGSEANKLNTEYLNYLRANIVLPVNNSTGVSAAKLDYKLMTSVPENWIPFIMKEQATTAKRQFKLQRATMPRVIDGIAQTTLVRPRTSILQYDTNGAYLINEEEVTLAGTIITTNFQRARWYNGATFSWVGRQRKTGLGQGNSGLAFDKLENKE